MTYEELKVDTIYTHDNSEYKVLYKHDESKVVLIQNLENGYTLVWGETFIKNFKPKVKPLPETGLLVYGSTNIIYYRTGKESGYGFNSSRNFRVGESLTFDAHPEDWREATKEDYSEFKELVIQHLKGLGFKDGDSFISLTSTHNCIIDFNRSIGFDGVRMYLGGKIVFDGNKWIQPISAKETEKEKLKALLNQMKDLLDSM